uniref:Mediator of RNA polymerase II transcription subunit 31 n=1 Tax=Oryza glaberrima TaxID=4538 RepID=I1Q8A9_ORYGL
MEEAEARPAPPDPNDARQRFLLELEFIQCLANPTYIHYLAQNRYFEDEAFIGYLKYLKYWQRPEYIKYIMYPHCLFFLELLQNANFRNAMAHPASKEIAHRQQYFFWKNYRNNRLKHILPRPPPEPTPMPATAPAAVPPAAPVPSTVVPPAAAPPSSLPPMSAAGASAMSPMQFAGTPGTNIPKNDMRNVMGGQGGRKRNSLCSDILPCELFSV